MQGLYPPTAMDVLPGVPESTIVYIAFRSYAEGRIAWSSRHVFHRALDWSHELSTDWDCCDCHSGWSEKATCGQIAEGCDHGGGMHYQAHTLGQLNLGRNRPCRKCWPDARRA